MIQDIAPHKLENPFDPQAAPREGDLLFVEKDHKLLIKETQEDICLPRYSRKLLEQAAQDMQTQQGMEVSQAELIYLFRLDGTACFWVRNPQDPLCAEMEAEGFAWYGLREIRAQGIGPRHLMFASYTALQLISWYKDNVYCGRCASRTVHSKTERALVCPACGRTIYPRIVPAVIVGVTDGDRIVLTKYSGRDVPYYALVAGFTEIGETLEETVAREVMEEVGLKVRNIRYYKSQPWAMADDILMGFFCDVDGDPTIRLDTNELKEGVWMRREEVILQPDTYSLTNEMMTIFKEGREPRT